MLITKVTILKIHQILILIISFKWISNAKYVLHPFKNIPYMRGRFKNLFCMLPPPLHTIFNTFKNYNGFFYIRITSGFFFNFISPSSIAHLHVNNGLELREAGYAVFPAQHSFRAHPELRCRSLFSHGNFGV